MILKSRRQINKKSKIVLERPDFESKYYKKKFASDRVVEIESSILTVRIRTMNGVRQVRGRKQTRITYFSSVWEALGDVRFA